MAPRTDLLAQPFEQPAQSVVAQMGLAPISLSCLARRVVRRQCLVITVQLIAIIVGQALPVPGVVEYRDVPRAGGVDQIALERRHDSRGRRPPIVKLGDVLRGETLAPERLAKDLQIAVGMERPPSAVRRVAGDPHEQRAQGVRRNGGGLAERRKARKDQPCDEIRKAPARAPHGSSDRGTIPVEVLGSPVNA